MKRGRVVGANRYLGATNQKARFLGHVGEVVGVPGEATEKPRERWHAREWAVGVPGKVFVCVG